MSQLPKTKKTHKLEWFFTSIQQGLMKLSGHRTIQSQLECMQSNNVAQCKAEIGCAHQKVSRS